MSLHPCRECRHAVSTEAQACPSCGAVRPAGLLPAARAPTHPSIASDVFPAPEFWKATRLVLRRVRVGLYGMGSGLFVALLTGSFVLSPSRAVYLVGMMVSLVLCLLAFVLELLDLYTGKGNTNDD